jgi:hypothetical protein
MSRTLHFQQITDSRLDEGADLKVLLSQLVQDTVEALDQLPSVVVQTGRPRRITFLGGSVVQWRVDFYVTKDRRTTWNKVYETVNRIRSANYSFLK